MADDVDIQVPPLTQREVWRNLAMWSVVCIISAAPSFFMSMRLGTEQHRIHAMITGVAIFIAAYTWVSCMPTWRRRRAVRIWHYTFCVGYITRIVISIVCPLAVIIDATCGGWTGSLLSWLARYELPRRNYPETNAFHFTLIWTLLQGVTLNLLLGIYMFIVFGVLRVCMNQPYAPLHPPHLCRQCGYDLRASADQCPECGTAIPGGRVTVPPGVV